MRIKLFVEGGGNSQTMQGKFREGFISFFRRAGLGRRMPKVRACGSRQRTYRKFQSEIRKAPSNQLSLLLVDSEGPVAKHHTTWQHLRHQDGWKQPVGATDDSAYLMVQFMESWFLADRDALAEYFGQGFNGKALPSNPNIEDIPKDDVLSGLEAATRQSSTKGKYGKGKDSFIILARIDPDKVSAASPHAKKLIDTLIDAAAA